MNNLDQRIAALSPEQRAVLERRLKEKGVASQQSSSIQKCDRSKPLPLSFSQQRMWLLEQLEPGNVTYNRPTHFRLSGVLDIEALTQSLQEIVQRHEVLRSCFPTTKGKPSLEINKTLPILLPLVDLSPLVESEQHKQLQRIINEDALTPFDLAATPLFRLQLIKLSETEHWLLFSLHHIVFDGWSAGVLQKEITVLYSAFSTRQASPLPKLAIQYVDFAQWQRQQLSETRIQSQLKYWKSKLSGELPVLELPTDRPRSRSATDEGATYIHQLPTTLANSLKSLSQRADATLFMTLLAAFKVLLYRYTQQTDIAVGVPVAGRDRVETESLIGIFINTIVLRTTLSKDSTFQDYLTQVRKAALEAYANQSLPFEEVVKALKPNRKLKNPFFQSFFQLRNLSNEISHTDTLRIEPLKLERESVAFDLSLDIVEKENELVCYFQYPTALFDSDTIVQMAENFQTLLRGISANPLMRINAGSSLPIPIAADETAFSVNAKSYEIAIESFPQLLEDLQQNLIQPQPQNLAQRSYFLSTARPTPGCVVSWSWRAAAIAAFFRALNFGTYENSFGLPKLHVAGNFYLIDSWETAQQSSAEIPGTIVALSRDSMRISTASEDVIVRSLQTLEGTPVNFHSWATRHHLQEGSVLKPCSDEQKKAIKTIETHCLKAENFWVERLLEIDPLSLPLPNAYRTQKTDNRKTAIWELSASLQAFLEKASNEERRQPTLSVILIAFLARLSQRNTFDLGLYITHEQSNNTALNNLFASIVPCHFDVDAQRNLSDTITEVSAQIEQAQRHKTFHRDIVSRYPALSSLKQVPVEQHFTTVISLPKKLNGTGYSPASPFEISIDKEGKCICLYDENRYRTIDVKRLLHSFSAFAEQWALHIEQPLSTISLLSPADVTDLTRWQQAKIAFPQKQTHELFEAQVEQTPDAIALIDGTTHETLTYQQLNSRANQLGHYLRSQNIKPETLVGLCIERSTNVIVGILGILKAGGAYLPLDPTYPTKRLETIIADAKPALILTSSQSLKNTPGDISKVCIDTQWAEIARWPESNLAPINSNNALAYVIYTSGSTGKPKGVMVEHAALANFALAACHTYGLTKSASPASPQHRVLQFASVSFDTAAEEIYPCLLSGGSLILRTEAAAGGLVALLEVCQQWQITVLDLPTAYWQQLVAEAAKSEQDYPLFPEPLRLIIIGGEKVAAESVAQWQQLMPAQINPPKLLNTYGPTEATVVATAYEIPNQSEAERLGREISIGEPLPNVDIYVLDVHQQQVPVGIPGELYIGGSGVARGYLNRPKQTANAFVTSHFDCSGLTRLYKTGDRVRYLPDGNLEYLGRFDHQIKIRGFRVELGEIETALVQQEGVQQSLVIMREDSPGHPQLAAYAIISDSAVVTASDLCQSLKSRLPDYMVPSVFILLESFPLTKNGKIDRPALPVPNQIDLRQGQAYTAPRNVTEAQLVKIVADVLGIEKAGIEDNFFEIGGHSLLATQVVVRIQDYFHIKIALRSIFEQPTIASLASLIAKQNTDAIPIDIPKISRSQPLPLSFAQQRLWFVDQFEVEDSEVYNISLALQLSGSLNVTALEQAISTIICRHEALRANFKLIEGMPYQVIRPVESVSLPVVDLQSHIKNKTTLEREAQVSQQFRRVLKTPFDLSCEPLLRVELLKLDTNLHMLLVNMHHIVSDGWSIGVFKRELSTLYRDFSQQQAPSLPPLLVQYADFAHWQRQQTTLAPHLEYWLSQLKGIPQQLELPTDYPRPLVQTFRGSAVNFQLSAELTKKLNDLARSSGATLFITLLAAFSALIHRYSSAKDIVIGSPVASRSRSETEPLIGFFVNTLLLRANLADDPTFSDLLAQLKQTALEAYNHQELPYEKIVEAINPERNLSYNPLFQVMFVLQNAATNPLNLPDIVATPIAIEKTTAKVDLTLSMRETSEGFTGTWEYNSDLFAAETIQRMAKHFEILLAGITADPLQFVTKLPLLTTAEQQKILADWNPTGSDYPNDQCLHQLFEQQVRRSPHAIAIAHGDEQLTYQALNHRANQLAHQLRPELKNIKSTAFVGICTEDTLQEIVSMLAVLKAGGAYVPIDVDYPEERLSFIIKDAQLVALIAQTTLKPKIEKITPAEVKIICCNNYWRNATIDNHSMNLPQSSPTASDSIAYLIYTSGSTGKPKGVQTPHRAVSRLVLNTNYIQLTPENRIAQISNTSFDAATFEIWGALLNGAQLIRLSKEVVLNPKDFVRRLRTANIDTLFLTTALFNQTVLLIPDAFSSLKTVLFGGEAAALSPARQVLHSGKPQKLVNVYGPTENTTFSTFYEITDVPKQATSLPIGRPIANSTAYVLDDLNQPVPIGIPGELCVGGEGLARGYLNCPELTANKFVEVSLFNTPSVRLYKTGDLVKRLPDGEIKFIGRKDFQVKVRGFRVELGEVESALLQISEVEAAVAIAQADASGNQAIIAYLTPRSSVTIDAAQVKSQLQQRLPTFMIPAVIRIVPELPLTPNGKVNRQLLLQTDQPAVSAPAIENKPRNETEQQLIQIWESCLGVKPIGIHDNFFDLGGHSLVATRVLFLIDQKLDLTFSINQLFKTPTIAGLFQELTDKDTVSLPSCLVKMKSSKEKSDSPTPPLFLVHAGGPSILFYRPLVEALTTDRSIYGIQSALLDGLATHSDSVFNSVEALAAFYINQIKAVQPDGPYLIGGASFGGIIAYEMAQQLVSQGDDIASLILLDRPAPGGRSRMSLAQRYRSYWTKLLKSGPTYLFTKIQRRTAFEKYRLQQRYKALRETIQQPATDSTNALYKRHVQLSEAYEPKTYVGKVFIVRAESMPEGFAVYEEDLGWSRYVKGGVKVLLNPGGHMTMFQAPYVKTLAAQIDTLLENLSYQ